VSPYVCFEFRPKKCTYDVMTDENETRENMMRVATEPCKAVCDNFRRPFSMCLKGNGGVSRPRLRLERLSVVTHRSDGVA
jgi:hypothetical protein